MATKREPELVIEFEEVPEFREAKRYFEAAYVEHLLSKTDGNMAAAARLSGKDRKDFYDLVRRTDVDYEAFRT